MPGVMRQVFHDTIRPELVTLLDSSVAHAGNSNPSISQDLSQLNESMQAQLADLRKGIEDLRRPELTFPGFGQPGSILPTDYLRHCVPDGQERMTMEMLKQL